MWLAVNVKRFSSENTRVALEVKESEDKFSDLVGRIRGINDNDVIEEVISFKLISYVFRYPCYYVFISSVYGEMSCMQPEISFISSFYRYYLYAHSRYSNKRLFSRYRGLTIAF